MVFTALPQRRFVSIAPVGGPAGHPNPSFVTVSEPLDGGASFLDPWATDGGPLITRTVSWASEMRVNVVASGVNGTTGIGGTTPSETKHQFIDPASVAPFPNSGGLRSLEIVFGRVVAACGVASTTAPIVYATELGPRETRLTRHEVAPGSFGRQLFTANIGGSIVVDDLVASPTPAGANGLFVVGRCDGVCTFASVPTLNSPRPVPVLAWTNYNPSTSGLENAPMNGLRALTDGSQAPLFVPSAPLRLATDGSQSFYVGGQGLGGELVVHQFAITTAIPGAAVVETIGPLRLVDMTRGPAGVLVLASLSDANVTFSNGGVLPWTPANQRNVVLIRIDGSARTSVWTWDVPGDQAPVAFAQVNGTVAIAINEGPNAVLWTLPYPPP